MDKKKFMQVAIDEAYAGIRNGDGGPFGCVIVRDDEIVGRGHNCVVKKNDPTCHGEMEAIRNACSIAGSFDLSGCELYTTAEPCPMCLGAVLWANIDKVYYGCTCADTENIGFRDSKFYEFLQGKNELIKLSELDRESCLELFGEYSAKKNKKQY